MTDAFAYGDLLAAQLRVEGVERFSGVPVFVSEYALEEVRPTILRTRWQRFCFWLETKTREAGLNWPWRSRYVKKPCAWKTPEGLIMHPAIYDSFKEAAGYPGGFAYDPFIARGLL